MTANAPKPRSLASKQDSMVSRELRRKALDLLPMVPADRRREARYFILNSRSDNLIKGFIKRMGGEA